MTAPDDKDIRRLSAALEELAAHRFVQIHNSTLRLVWYQFLRGLAFGFGTVVGASALVSIVVVVLSQIELVPVIGSLATEIIREIEDTRP